MSLPLRITLRIVTSIALVWALATYVPQYFVVTGGLRAWVVLGVLLAILNLVVRPLLSLITLPLKLVATLAAFFVLNGVFLWIALEASKGFDATLLTFNIAGGVMGWAVCIFLVGAANSLLKMIIR